MAKAKLNKLQSGSLQYIFSMSLALVCLSAIQVLMAYILHKNASLALFPKLSMVVFFAVLTSLAGYYLIKLSMRLNLVLPVTLPKVIEFSHAMQTLRILNFDKQVDFLSEKDVHIFLAPNPILQTTAQHLLVKKYIALQNRKTLKFYNGDNRLCLDFDDYEQLLREQEELSSVIYAKQRLTHNNEVETLKATLALLHEDMAKVTQEKTACCTELEELKKKQQTVSARDAKADKREHDRVVFWRVAAPMINRLLADAGPKTLYTRPQIQAAFEEELKKFPQLQASIATLLETPKKKADGKCYDLEGWGMDIIRKSLGDYVKR